MLKYLLLIGVIAAAYYGYRYYNRLEAAKQKAAEDARLREQAQHPAQPSAQPARAAEMAGEDMVACPGCGTYRPVGATTPCDTPGCSTTRA
ncbi:hypothetical protein [Ferrovibrio sp.]|uniref:hypothetical protein n=1 Tax=Ferrovibrio sp. TaxID=1917215 RepID=UPI003D149632